MSPKKKTTTPKGRVFAREHQSEIEKLVEVWF